MDPAWDSVGTMYHGGRLGEYLVGLWLGVGLPLLALRTGTHVASALQRSPPAVSCAWPPPPPRSP